MGQILYIVLVGVVLLVMFTVLVAAHEFGHYLFARMFNMGVEEFAIGFGKFPRRGSRAQYLTWMKRQYRVPMLPGQVKSIEQEETPKFDLEATGSRPSEDIVVIDTLAGPVLQEVTRFTIRPWPLGGYVRIKGMIPEDDGSETTIAGGFYSKAPWKRLLVLFAGPLFSVLAGVAILTPLKMYTGGAMLNKPVLAMISEDSPAHQAGLKDGDEILSINGAKVSTFYDVVQIVRKSANKELVLDVERGGHELQISVTPKLEATPSLVIQPDLSFSSKMERQFKLGASPPRKKVGVGEAFEDSLEAPLIAVEGLLSSVGHPSEIKDNVGGPITISRFTYDTVKLGIPAILSLAALLSISVGIFNLLPWAPLDGGQMTMAFAEMLRGGRRLSIRVQSIINGVGLLVMCILIIGVFAVDIGRLVGGQDPLKPPPPKPASKAPAAK